ncbi:NUDIX hydrolase [Pseudomonas caricapapayae]|uniref:NUDIX hydrolase n=1 Tax=Pseudomonas caricapapayae TaxID=46678 RepID=UPI000F0102E2|nr:NUDIX hydrolase [Pseudomonas caricapapayae]
MINPIKHSFSHLGSSNAQGASTSHSDLVPNFVSRGRTGKVSLTHFDTHDERHLANRQNNVLESIDGRDFMLLLQKYTAAETTNEEFAVLRAAIPRYSIELAEPGRSKLLYRGISLGRASASILLTLPKGYYSREVAHGLVHGMQLSDGSYSGRGVASTSTVSAISESFALTNAIRKKEVPILFELEAMPPVPELKHSGAKGVTLSISRLPSSAAGKSEHEVILDITNRYEITEVTHKDKCMVVKMTVLGRSKRGDELAALETDKWKQLSTAKGSNPGGLFQAPDGVKWYVKTGRSTDNFHNEALASFRNEVLASKLYSAAGVAVPDVRLASRHGKPALISRLVDGTQKDLATMARSSQLKCGFAVDVWLGNWDVIGREGDNVVFSHNHKPVRIDLGGALVFRAGGERKGNFGVTPMELVTLLSRKENTSSYVFQNIERNDIRAGIAAIEKIPDARIAELCAKHGSDNRLAREALGEVLIRRKRWLVSVKQELPYIHPRKNELGQVVTVKNPTLPSGVDTWRDSSRTAVFVPHRSVRGSLNNTPFKSFQAPGTLSEWSRIRTRAVAFAEPSFQKHDRLRSASGAIVFEPDGRVWVTEPTDHVFGTAHSFPKGGLENGLNLRTNAVKEVYEETGLHVQLYGFIGDYDRTTSRTRYYLAKRVDGTPSDMGFESQSLKLARLTEAGRLLSSELDTTILLDAVKVFQKTSFH